MKEEEEAGTAMETIKEEPGAASTDGAEKPLLTLTSAEAKSYICSTLSTMTKHFDHHNGITPAQSCAIGSFTEKAFPNIILLPIFDSGAGATLEVLTVALVDENREPEIVQAKLSKEYTTQV